ncbi:MULTISPECIES: hypothetical protein [unclassified Polaribacter]|uniref:hypothetical protein n=1 Tax=unclassified Polaribacter TaxID=196858 RepID=UPI0011BDD350|nr:MULTISPECIES: hypothetical protein [unclassified Polaribacter]TXD54059.1 hypothetical protein ES043_02040 [Polaribacter sp. IC063]TXD62575.1 hypothetical protein ES044_01070 [Polaribacter sp. IC066]
MKKLKLLLIAIIITSFTSFTSCSEDELKCDSSLVKRTVKELFEEEMLKEIENLKNIRGIDEDYLKHFYTENIELELIRTRAVNEKLKSCDCSASIVLKLKSEVENYILEEAEKNKLKFTRNQIKKLLNQKVDVDYQAQETSEGEIIVETLMPDEIGDLLSTSYSFENYYKENVFILEKGKEYSFGYGTEDCSYEIIFKINKNEKVEGTHNQNCVGNNGAGLRKFTGKFKNGKIIGEIKDAESFELNFNDKIMEYTLTKSIMQNGKEINYSKESRSKMTIEYELIE